MNQKIILLAWGRWSSSFWVLFTISFKVMMMKILLLDSNSSCFYLKSPTVFTIVQLLKSLSQGIVYKAAAALNGFYFQIYLSVAIFNAHNLMRTAPAPPHHASRKGDQGNTSEHFSKISVLGCELHLKPLFRREAEHCGHPPSFPLSS